MTSGRPRWGHADQPTLTRRSDTRSPWRASTRSRPRLQRLERGVFRESARTMGSSGHTAERGAKPRSTPDRSKLIGSHGQRPWLQEIRLTTLTETDRSESVRRSAFLYNRGVICPAELWNEVA